MVRSTMAVWVAAALLTVAGTAVAAPGKSGEAAAAARQAKPMQREELKARAEVRVHAADEGVREQAREERTERVRETDARGSETAGEMQARREERERLQQEYRESTGAGPKAKKKPWWKFWGSDEDAAAG